MKWILCCLAGLALTNPGVKNPNPWVKVNEQKDLVIWNRDVPGSSVRELRAEAYVDFPVDKVWEVIDDIEKYTEFMPYIEQIKVVERAPDKVVAYHRFDAPLVAERDYTLTILSEMDVEKKIYRRTWSATNDKGPKSVSGIVRVDICDGSWMLTADGPNRTRLVYFLHTNPGGSVPMWIANKANSVSLPDLFTAIRNRTKDSKWTR